MYKTHHYEFSVGLRDQVIHCAERQVWISPCMREHAMRGEAFIQLTRLCKACGTPIRATCNGKQENCAVEYHAR